MHWVLTRAVNFPHVQKAFRCRFSSFLLRANTRSFFLLLLSLTFLSFFATTCRIGQNGNKRDKERERVRVLYACAFLDRISRGFRGIESSCLPCVGKHLQGQICPRQFWSVSGHLHFLYMSNRDCLLLDFCFQKTNGRTRLFLCLLVLCIQLVQFLH